jgi:hypothetical protein
MKKVIQTRLIQSKLWKDEQLRLVNAAVARGKQEHRTECCNRYRVIFVSRFKHLVWQLNQVITENPDIFGRYFARRPDRLALAQHFFMTARSFVPEQKIWPQDRHDVFINDYSLAYNVLESMGIPLRNVDIWSSGTLYYRGRFIYVGDESSMRIIESGMVIFVKVLKISIREMEVQELKGYEPFFVVPEELGSRYEFLDDNSK